MPRFPVTRHSMVAAIRSGETEVRHSAFDALARAYWRPVFKYVRLKWHATPDEAADLTQAFFLRAFEKDFFSAFDPSRARFRTFLRTCLDRFVANARQSENRLKRGGGVRLVSLDLPAAERELQLQARDAVADFDEFFHREWLRGLFSAAAARLREACAARGRPQRFALFEEYDLADDEAGRPSYAALARHYDLSATDVTNELAAARREFRRLVLAALREQCATDEEYEAEVRALGG